MRLTWRSVVALLVCVGAAVAVGGSAAGALSARMVRVGFAPRHPAGSTVLGTLPASTPMRITVELRPRDPSALTAFATAVSTPGSSVYRQFLTVPEFRSRFAPTDAQIAAVQTALQADGLDPGPVTANGLAIPVLSTVGEISSAFSTELQQVRLASGRVALANEQAPLIDRSIAGYVQDVIGLNNFYVPQPGGAASPAGFRNSVRAASPAGFRNSVRRPTYATGGPQPCSAAVSAAPGHSSLTADAIAYSYQASGLYAQGDEGQGQTIAVYELGGYSSTDLSAYESCYGISPSVTNVLVDGGTATESDSEEAALDIDDVVGLAPKAKVLVYIAPNTTAHDTTNSAPWDDYNSIVSQDQAKVVTTSWGGCEAIEGTAAQQDEYPLFEEAATQGQAVFAYSGDYGSTSCAYNSDDSLAVTDPAAQPFVTGVGGTSLTPGLPPTESVWNDECGGGACGGGGGLSDLWPMPSYQIDTPGPLNVINSFSSPTPCGVTGTVCRETPDVSADADPDGPGYEIYFNGGWTGYGGTSGATPTWAALMTLINASSDCHGVPVGFANPALYGAASNDYAADFNDITIGSNAIPSYGQTADYPATIGYDLASGLGSPKTTALAGTLCDPAVLVTIPGTQISAVRTAVSIQVTGSDADGLALHFGASGLPSGLSIAPSSGAISGTLTAGGIYRVTVTATDTRGDTDGASFEWIVTASPTVSSKSLSGIAKGKPKLKFRLAEATGVQKLVITLPKGLSFARGRALKRGVKLGSVKGFKLRLSGGKLTITLRSSVPKLSVTIASPAIKASRSLIAKVSHKRSGKLRVSLKITDATGRATVLNLRLKPF